MRKLFKEHIKKTPDEIKIIWDDCIFVFDANIYLNLYRYSDEVKNQTLDIINKANGNIRAPFQVIKEYLKNRNRVIIKEDDNLNLAINDLNKLVNKFENERENPFLSKETLKLYLEATNIVKSEIQENIKTNINKISNDDLLDKIFILLEGKVISEYTYEEKLEIYKHGITRYNKKIPPGYEDTNKIEKFKDINEKDVEINFDKLEDVFGDLLIWLQTIDIAKENKRNIVFVSGDLKDDWINKEKGKKTGPHPELIKEFQDKTNQEIIIYDFLHFLHSYSEYREKISAIVISEVKHDAEKSLEKSKQEFILYNRNLNIRSIEDERIVIDYEKFSDNIEENIELFSPSFIVKLIKARRDLKEQLEMIEWKAIKNHSTNNGEIIKIENNLMNSIQDKIHAIEHKIYSETEKLDTPTE